MSDEQQTQQVDLMAMNVAQLDQFAKENAPEVFTPEFKAMKKGEKVLALQKHFGVAEDISENTGQDGVANQGEVATPANGGVAAAEETDNDVNAGQEVKDVEETRLPAEEQANLEEVPNKFVVKDVEDGVAVYYPNGKFMRSYIVGSHGKDLKECKEKADGLVAKQNGKIKRLAK